MTKLLLIGFDSIDPHVLVKYAEFLPTFSKIQKKPPIISLKSVFPVDSIPAWASIYTGSNPGSHGIVKSFDVFDKDISDILKIDINILKGKTFWDYASNAGKRVCVLYPLLGYPPWKVNGIMISRQLAERKIDNGPQWITERETLSYPTDIREKYNIPRFMKGISGKHPGNSNLRKWSDEGKNCLMNEAQIGLEICQKEQWDLFFIYFSWLDIIQHRLWRYCDEADPMYPGANKYGDIIKEFYVLADVITNNFLNLCPDANSIIFSDHGHGSRPSQVVNINKVLRENGYSFAGYKNINLREYIIEKIKLNLLEITNKYGLDWWLVNVSTKTNLISSFSKNVYMSNNFTKDKNLAQLSDFAGLKSYSHGGIFVNKSKLGSEAAYENLRDNLIVLLQNLTDNGTGKHLVKWACRRERLYKGTKVNQSYPDIVFELEENYGTGWNKYSSLISKAYDHNLASGGHKKDAVFLMYNINKKIFKNNLSVIDIAPTVLDLLEITGCFNFDGISAFNKNLK